jgi:4-hydroxy-2-oxoheptanedioate aldolase
MMPSAFAAEIVSASGCDWLCIDLQHGLIAEETMRLMVQAAAIRSTPVLVRVPWNEPGSIMRALDAGAEGVIVPMVNTSEEAKLAVSASRYPPLGIRSWGPLRSGMAESGFTASIGNERTLCIVMIETVVAFDNLEQILDVPGVDGVLVGPNDLAISHSGDNAGAARAPKDVAMIQRIAEVCRSRSVIAAISCAAIDADRWERVGYSLIALPSDAALLGAGMASELAVARSKSRST